MAFKLLTVKSYAKQFGLNTGSVYKKVKQGLLKSKVENGRIFIVNYDEVNNKTLFDENVEILDTELINTVSLEVGEFEAMKKRIAELETLTKYFDSIVAENRELRDENKQLRQMQFLEVSQNPQNSNKSSLIYKNNEEIKLDIYLTENGFIKKDRDKILNFVNMQLTIDERFIKKDNNIFINLYKYVYNDLFEKINK
jgi:regulator of replication initiation timing